MTIHLFNPRKFLRAGSSEPMRLAADGHTVILRPGTLGNTILTESRLRDSPEWAPLAGKAFRLVELSPHEIEELQRQLDAQE